MFKLKSRSQVVEIDETTAEYFVTLPPLDHDRELKSTRVDRLGDRIERGLAIPFIWASCFVDGVEYRINGQHSSELLYGMFRDGALTSPTDLEAIVSTFVASDMESAAQLWAQYDAKISCRTSNDVYLTWAATIPSLNGVPRKVIQACATGFALDHYGLSSSAADSEQRMVLVAANVPRVLFVSNLVKDGSATKLFCRGAVIGAVSRCHRKCASEAEKFWTMVRDGTATSPHHPTRTLREYLITTTEKRGNGATRGKRSATSADIFTHCIHAWNAFREKRELKIINKPHQTGDSLPNAL